jgi:hypothetical protein
MSGEREYQRGINKMTGRMKKQIFLTAVTMILVASKAFAGTTQEVKFSFEIPQYVIIEACRMKNPHNKHICKKTNDNNAENTNGNSSVFAVNSNSDWKVVVTDGSNNGLAGESSVHEFNGNTVFDALALLDGEDTKGGKPVTYTFMTE